MAESQTVTWAITQAAIEAAKVSETCHRSQTWQSTVPGRDVAVSGLKVG